MCTQRIILVLPPRFPPSGSPDSKVWSGWGHHKQSHPREYRCWGRWNEFKLSILDRFSHWEEVIYSRELGRGKSTKDVWKWKLSWHQKGAKCCAGTSQWSPWIWQSELDIWSNKIQPETMRAKNLRQVTAGTLDNVDCYWLNGRSRQRRKRDKFQIYLLPSEAREKITTRILQDMLDWMWFDSVGAELLYQSPFRLNS